MLDLHEMPQLDHVVIHVTDWERSNAFYRDVIGGDRATRRPDRIYRIGAVQLNVHGPGVTPAMVARVPVAPANSDLCFAWPARSPPR